MVEKVSHFRKQKQKITSENALSLRNDPSVPQEATYSILLKTMNDREQFIASLESMLSIFIENFNNILLTAPHLGFSSTNELIPNPSHDWIITSESLFACLDPECRGFIDPVRIQHFLIALVVQQHHSVTSKNAEELCELIQRQSSKILEHMNASPCGEVTLRSFKCYLLHQNLFNKHDLLTLTQNLKRLNQIYASGELFVPLQKYPFIQKHHSFFKYPPVLLQLALNALSLPQMELSINGAISKMQKQALLDQAIGASFPIHHGLGLSQKLIAFLCSSFWHSYPAKNIEGTVVVNEGALSQSLQSHFQKIHPPLQAFSNSKLRPGSFSAKQYIEGVMLYVASNFNRVNQSILLFILRSLRGSIQVQTNPYPLLHKDASLEIIAQEEHNRPDSTKSPYSTSRAPSGYNSSTQRSYNTERRVSSRYEQRANSPDKRGASSPLIMKYQQKQRPPPAARKKTPVRTLVIPGISPRAKETPKNEVKIVTSSINLQRKIASPKKVSASIPSFQIALPPPPPELKDKASAVLKNLRSSQPQSARLPMGSSRSRVSTLLQEQQNIISDYKSSNDISSLMASVEEGRTSYTEQDERITAKLSIGDFSTKSARVQRSAQPRQNTLPLTKRGAQPNRATPQRMRHKRIEDYETVLARLEKFSKSSSSKLPLAAQKLRIN